VGLPRTDLKVTLDGVELKAGFALGSWLAFEKMGDQGMVVGDLVLTMDEVAPVGECARSSQRLYWRRSLACFRAAKSERRCWLRKATFAGMGGKEEDAPIAAFRGCPIQLVGSTHTVLSLCREERRCQLPNCDWASSQSTATRM